MRGRTDAQDGGLAGRHRALRPADLMEIILAHFWLAVTVGLTAALASGWVLLNQPKVFEARDLVLVQLGRDQVYVPDAPVSGLRTPDPGDFSTYVNAEMAVLRASAVREDMLDRLLATGALSLAEGESRAAMLDKLDDQISIGAITGSYLIDIRVRVGDPALAGAIAGALLDAYRAERPALLGQDPPAYLQAEIAASLQRIAAIADRAASLTGGASIEAQDAALSALADERASAQRDLADLEAASKGIAARISALQDRIAAPPVDQASGTVERDRALALLVQAEVDGAANEAEVAAAKGRLAHLDAESARLAKADQALAPLRVEQAAELAALSQLWTRLSDSRLNAARAEAGLGTVRVIEKGAVKPGPVGLPDRIKRIVAGLLGLLTAALVVLLPELNLARAHTADIAAGRFGVPVLGEIEERPARPPASTAGQPGARAPAERSRGTEGGGS